MTEENFLVVSKVNKRRHTLLRKDRPTEILEE